MPTTEQQQVVVTSLTARYGATRLQVETNLLQQLVQLVLGMRGRWYDNLSVARFKRDVLDLVRPGQEGTADLTAGYLDQVLDELDSLSRPGAVRLPERLRAVDPLEEWERPAKVYRRARLLGLDDLAAQERAEQRATDLARMDLALAAREGARQRLVANPRVTGYRRIIHPELSQSGTCGLCLVAADRVYKAAELLPLHGGCQCTVLPITTAHDPGLKLNNDDLGAVYAAADASRSRRDRAAGSSGGTAREDLQRVRIVFNEHGELGPILSRAGENFRDAADVEADTSAA
jgi:hypothetical protein